MRWSVRMRLAGWTRRLWLHGGATVARLEHSSARVREAALMRLASWTRCPCFARRAIVARLKDSDADVRREAMDVLGRLERRLWLCTAARSSRGSRT